MKSWIDRKKDRKDRRTENRRTKEFLLNVFFSIFPVFRFTRGWRRVSRGYTRRSCCLWSESQGLLVMIIMIMMMIMMMMQVP